MLAINNLQKPDPSHVPSQPVTTVTLPALYTLTCTFAKNLPITRIESDMLGLGRMEAGVGHEHFQFQPSAFFPHFQLSIALSISKNIRHCVSQWRRANLSRHSAVAFAATTLRWENNLIYSMKLNPFTAHWRRARTEVSLTTAGISEVFFEVLLPVMHGNAALGKNVI